MNKNIKNLSLIVSLVTLLVLNPKFSQQLEHGYVVKATPIGCTDTIIHCWCVNGDQLCAHQLTNCTMPTETHNEMPGAEACTTSQPSPTTSSTNSATLVGVGGGPVTSSTPAVVASQSDNQAGELPKTGLPLVALALIGLAPLGYKLKNFTSKFNNHYDAGSIWTSKQLKK